MPIEALPQATVRAIGSTSVISDPCSVVKELLDNALDASATSVSVEISPNTLDVIQVKDNGHGIPAEDHPCVCKHAFTSKISTINDLKNVGGSSLGFRGEALASIADMSGGVTVITRVASEIVASNLEYGRDGELSQSQKTSHPVGTTVRIRNFLKHIPVRRQTALKGATKCLAKIKALVQAYAMAQPSKRFSFKVIKARNENNNWSFVPGADIALADASVKVVGRDVASCCTTKESTCTPNAHNAANLDQKTYLVTAFLPKADADFSKANNKGQFLSIDGRPLSTSRGVGHDIVKLFKSYVRAASSKGEAPKSVSDPFLCLQLRCPLGSYDVNIEPGKDDVLFEDRELVFALIGNLFADNYGALPDAATKNSAKKAASSNDPANDAGFDLLMARKPAQASQIVSIEESGPLDVPLITSPGTQRSSHSPSVASSEQTPHNGGRGRGLDNNLVSGSGSSRHINPWSISRINASFQAPEPGDAPSSAVPLSPATTSQAARQRHTPQRPTLTSPVRNSEQSSPVYSTRTPVSPLNHRRNPPTPHESPLQPASSISASRRAARERDRERYGNGALDTWFQRTTQASLDARSPEALGEADEASLTLSQLAEQRFNPPRGVPVITLPLKNNTRSLSHDPRREQTPDPSPQQIDRSASPDNDHQTRSMDSGRGFPVLENWAASIHEGFTPESSAELEKALDFERRKREANQLYRTRSKQLNVGARIPSSNSPHRSRYLAAKAALAADSTGDSPPSAMVLPPGDPRSYLISLQANPLSNDSVDAPGMLRRSRTSRLPFERIPEGLDLHNLRLPVKACSLDIHESFNLTARHDHYTGGGDEPESSLLSGVTALLPFWNEKLNTILSKGYKTNDSLQPPDLCIDISTAIADLGRHFRTAESQSP
ncbi:DNA mismatch repair protein C-terminal [Penicillium cataractarum]|uniref:DNA mismatch repair protein C-terminal n=1 Tax=Penicillium cataractarum TaxID=2100454 RepID=A0A9W9R7R4_9EURO|nr:DNA mismatch repair protein C-terminal [Penicillium cataractarum]KAJ5355146.1 DNA mismatch repair protein C-terminal [Penicillium cataractarum]